MTLKSSFPEWYGHDEDTVKKIVIDGTICFDTNALLDLYRVNKDQRQEILEVLRGVSGRTFIPYQVAWEFHKNRFSAVRSNQAIYTTLIDSRFDLLDKQLKQLHDEKLREEIKELHKEITKAFDKAVTKFQTAVAKLRDEHTISIKKMIADDPVLDALESALTESVIGLRPPSDVLKSRREAALWRLALGIPPGFKDSAKDDPTGDYLVWCELLDHAESSSRPLLFVTNDKKEDWYRPSESGTSLGPRAELVVEMRERSPETLYHQADLGSFLYYAREYLGLSVEDETITTVENIEPEPPRTAAPRMADYSGSAAYPGIAGFDPATFARMYSAPAGVLSPAALAIHDLQTSPVFTGLSPGAAGAQGALSRINSQIMEGAQGALARMNSQIMEGAQGALARMNSQIMEGARIAAQNLNFMPGADLTATANLIGGLGQLYPENAGALSAVADINARLAEAQHELAARVSRRSAAVGTTTASSPKKAEHSETAPKKKTAAKGAAKKMPAKEIDAKVTAKTPSKKAPAKKAATKKPD